MVLTIGEASKRSGYSEVWIRELEKRGVVKPERDSAGRRIFSLRNIEALLRYKEKIQGEKGRPL